MNDIPKVIAVAGPTASGKSALALYLAQKLGGEIISCDSMQIYRGMDIGTAKDPPEELALVPHHMIDIADPSESFSCSDYADMAAKCAYDVISRGKLPIFCGGTGLYLDSVLAGDRYPEIKTDDGLRERLNSLTRGELLTMLRGCDYVTYRTADIQNPRRVIRALEIFYTTGIPKSAWDERSASVPPRFDALKLAISYSDRDKLYTRIDHRVDMMFEAGLADEARRLYDAGLSYTAKQAIGYKELFSYIAAGLDPADAADEVKQATRRYAKRQLTWLRRDPDVVWLDAEDPELREKAESMAVDWIGISTGAADADV